MHVVFVGPDRGLGSALEAHGATVIRVSAPATAQALGEADIQSADLLVISDTTEATAVPVAHELNPAVRVVVYSPDSLPEFVSGQVDLVVSPAVLDAEAIAEELVGAPEAKRQTD